MEISQLGVERSQFQAIRERTFMRKTRPVILLPLACLTFLVLCPLVFAAAPARTHEITIDDYFTEAFLNGCAVSPDGRWVAYVELRWQPPSDDRNTDLWVVNTQSAEVRRLTFDPAADTDPVWSADSRWVYFLSRRGEKDGQPPLNKQTQVWRISLEGGEPQAVTRLKNGVDGFALSRDGKTLYYLASAEAQADEWKDLREQFDNLDYGRGVDNFSAVWTLDLTNWRAEKLMDPQRGDQ
jgi:dipeptidyl aminopeptidase/acylaminoacyl peptidase